MAKCSTTVICIVVLENNELMFDSYHAIISSSCAI